MKDYAVIQFKGAGLKKAPSTNSTEGESLLRDQLHDMKDTTSNIKKKKIPSFKMETSESKAKKRMLPQWMSETKADGKEDHSKRVKKKKRPLMRSPKKRVVYCMNEAELVEAALEVLSRSHKKEDTVEDMLKVESDPESPSRPTELQESSRTNKDTTHLPIENSPSSPLESDLQSSESRDPPDEDDDPLKFVREIFFN